MSDDDNGPSAREIASLSATGRRAYLRQIRANIKAAQLGLKEALRERSRLLADVRHRCKVATLHAKRRKREIRDRYLRDVDTWLANEKKQAEDICVHELAEVKRSAAAAIDKAKKRKAALQRKKDAIDNLSGEADRRRKAGLRRKEREGEADDFVANDLEGEEPGIREFFLAHARGLFAPSKVPHNRSRAEHVLHYIHENPEAFIRWRQDDAERKVLEWEAKEAAHYAELERAKKADRAATKKERAAAAKAKKKAKAKS